MDSIDKKLVSDEYGARVEEGLKNLHKKADDKPERNEAASRSIFQQELYYLARSFSGSSQTFLRRRRSRGTRSQVKHSKDRGRLIPCAINLSSNTKDHLS